MQTDYIPRKDTDFNMFQRILSETVQAKLAAWNINTLAFNKLQTARAPYEIAYTKNSNRSMRTTTHVMEHRRFRNEYTAAIRTFVKEQIAGNTSITDPERAGIKLNAAIRTKHKRSGIDDTPMVSSKTMNGGWIQMIVRTDSDSSRSSMHPLADAIEVAYTIDTTAPLSPGGCGNNFISTKAKFIIPLDVKHAGKRMYGFARWKNIRNHAKSGPWSRLFQTMIAD